jgi:MoxR-like ATPase
MLTGERGIGKTSLLNYLKFVARGDIEISKGERVKFLIIDLDLDGSTTDVGLIRRIETALKRTLEKSEIARSFLAKGWEFLQRVEAFGVKVHESQRTSDREMLHDEFAHSFAATVNRITQADAGAIFGTVFDGVIILIDEADNAPAALKLGSLLKLFSERVQRHDCTKFMLGLAGAPGLLEVLRESHPSSLRIFDQLPLGQLSNEEVAWVIDRALREANTVNEEQTTIEDSARLALIRLSEGYPHFIQQFGYSAFAADSDGNIDDRDVYAGAFGRMGALETIGDQYYRDDFYSKIQKESYRQVLRIMADRQNNWISKEEIRASFKGKKTILNNAIKALLDRKIILAKEGERGMYRLQHAGFAVWIKTFTTDPVELQTQIEEATVGNGKPAQEQSDQETPA